jgi:hypothetical protein
MRGVGNFDRSIRQAPELSRSEQQSDADGHPKCGFKESLPGVFARGRASRKHTFKPFPKTL